MLAYLCYGIKKTGDTESPVRNSNLNGLPAFFYKGMYMKTYPNIAKNAINFFSAIFPQKTSAYHYTKVVPFDTHKNIFACISWHLYVYQLALICVSPGTFPKSQPAIIKRLTPFFQSMYLLMNLLMYKSSKQRYLYLDRGKFSKIVKIMPAAFLKKIYRSNA